MQYQQQYPHNYPQKFPTQGGGLMMPPDLAAMAQQGYAVQQAQLQAMAAGRPPLPHGVRVPGMQGLPHGQQGLQGVPGVPGMHVGPGMGAVPPGGLGALQQAQAQAMSQIPKVHGANIAAYPHIGRNFGGKKVERRITNETLKQFHSKLGPPQRGDEYAASALMSSSQERIEHVEPWADAMDEVDPRELAMNRFRARQSLLGEIFGPEPLKSIPIDNGDSWEGFGMDGETLEAKVADLEKENAELEKRIAGQSTA